MPENIADQSRKQIFVDDALKRVGKLQAQVPAGAILASTIIENINQIARTNAKRRYEDGPGRFRPSYDHLPESDPIRKKNKKTISAYISRFAAEEFDTLLPKALQKSEEERNQLLSRRDVAWAESISLQEKIRHLQTLISKPLHQQQSCNSADCSTSFDSDRIKNDWSDDWDVASMGSELTGFQFNYAGNNIDSPCSLSRPCSTSFSHTTDIADDVQSPSPLSVNTESCEDNFFCNASPCLFDRQDSDCSLQTVPSLVGKSLDTIFDQNACDSGILAKFETETSDLSVYWNHRNEEFGQNLEPAPTTDPIEEFVIYSTL